MSKLGYTLEIYMNTYLICVQFSNNVFKSSIWLSNSNRYRNWNSIKVYSIGGNLLDVYRRGDFIPQYPEQNTTTQFFKTNLDILYKKEYDKNFVSK